MPQFIQSGQNPAALGLPDLFIAIQPPPAPALPGAPANIIGVVGTANWGPTNSPAPFSDFASGAAVFGDMQNRKYDLLTQVALAYMQGGNNFLGVRVTDGTDVAATATIGTNGITLTAKYTGTRGNKLTATIANGSAANSSKMTISMPGLPPETFDNITGTGNAFWVNLANAINNGQSAFRPASALVTATAGVGTTAPVNGTTTLASGTDGATTITGTVLLGVDTTPRKGMYALRNTGLALLVLADCDDSTTWSTQLAFAQSELCEAIAVGPSGDTISNFVTTMSTAGVDDPWIKVCFGDYVQFLDTVNGVLRVVSPQGVFAGKKAAVGAAESVLNKEVFGIVGTQKSLASQVYSNAELQSLAQARGDVIVNPSVGGPYFSARFGRNSSSDPGKHQDPYTTYTNYIARSMALSLGEFVGRLMTPDEMREAASAIGGFLENERVAGRLSSYSVQIDDKNNPTTQTQLGIQKATVLVRYFGVVEYFLVDFAGGQTVTPKSTQA